MKLRPNNIPIGSKFNRLTVLSKEPTIKGHSMYRCLCDCGKEIITRGSALLSDNTKGCGCVNVETYTKTFKKHRDSIVNGATINGKHSPEYHAWQHMRDRCYNEKVDRFPAYGGRGIIVCERWLKSFSNFLSDMGRRPSPVHSLDRIDVNGNYEPANCRWATQEQQMSNRQNTVRIIVNNEIVHQKQLAKILGVNDHSIEYNLKKGKSGDEIVAYFKNKKL